MDDSKKFLLWDSKMESFSALVHTAVLLLDSYLLQTREREKKNVNGGLCCIFSTWRVCVKLSNPNTVPSCFDE